MKRRELLQTALTVSAATLLQANAAGEPTFQIIDSNVSLFRWPFRRLPLDETSLLVEKLRSIGVRKAFAGSFEGVFQRDLAGVNRRLAETCEKNPELVPFGSVNPALAGWKSDLRACADKYGMPGIRLHPNYHGYALDDSRFRDLLVDAVEADLLVQIAVTMEDIRTQNASAAVPDVDLSLLPAVVGRISGARIQILNWRPRGPVLAALAYSPEVVFDTARVDGTDGIEQLEKVVTADRVVFGSHAPFLIPEAALIRVMHESQLDESRLRKIVQSNAEREEAMNR